MARQAPSAGGTTVSSDEVRQALEKILHSRYFVNAQKKKDFLRVICDFYLEGRAHELNEHSLGFDVFGRSGDFNPSADPIVRVVAHEIRKKLEAYYQNEGAGDPVRMEIPPGSYQPAFTRSATDEPVPAPVDGEPRSGWRRRILVVGLSLLALALAIGLVVELLDNRQLRERVEKAERATDPVIFGDVWSAFLNDAKPPLVILSNPPVLRFTNPSDPEAVTKDSIEIPPQAALLLEDKFVTNPEVSIKEPDTPSDDKLHEPNNVVVERNRTPRLIMNTNSYTGMGEAIGLHYLTDFFGHAGRSIFLKQSRTLSADDLKKHNVILLGGAWVNEWSSKLATTDDFVFTSKATIANRNPQQAEEREYVPQFDGRTGSLIVDYALITVKPNISDANQVMSSAGVYSQGTEAAAEYVTDKNYLDQLNRRLSELKQPNRPGCYFQALLKVGVENGIPTTITVLALHELRIPEA
jgi:hypothetical protein